jgi:hypothetical protein
VTQRTALWSALVALTLVAAQFGAIRFAPSAVAVRIALPVTIAAVPLALWPLRGRLGTWIMFVGLAANLAVILANGGLMPIERSTVAAAAGEERAARYRPGAWISGSKDVLVDPGGGHAVALGDSIVVHVGAGGFVASPGDIIVWAGLVVLAGEASLAWQRRASRGYRAGSESGERSGGERAEGSAAT